MRRKDRQVSDLRRIVEIISRCDVIRIGINGGDYPYIVPMNFGYDVKDENITFYLHSAMDGRKMQLLEKDSRVCFELDCGHQLMLLEKQRECSMAYESVMGTGTIELLQGDDKLPALQRLMEHYRGENFDFDKTPVAFTAVMKLTVNSIDGKCRRMKS
jgi:nitroimidazol reductase NimA-like FMN-containing flavoprotein (pyridoxamine 5'-phosphate oxidase superfamily)